MISVIVFTKGRPMQLHAYIESLITYADVVEEMISVLYCPMEEISYQKVMDRFPKVNWIIETSFLKDLKKVIYEAGDYIMFGCDDVVFTNPFQLQEASNYLEKNDQVFGYSVRLGNNILPQPDGVESNDNIFEWNWKTCNQRHYNYPWELDCTLYRKSDVIRITEADTTGIVKNPNYYEAIVTDENKEQLLNRPHMACTNGKNCAIVITVNRVQDTHPNEFDDCFQTDIFTLNRLYNEENNCLDLHKISQIENTEVHVGAECFILKDAKKEYGKSKIVRAKYRKKIEQFVAKIYRVLERQKYKAGYYSRAIQIETIERSIDLLEQHRYSMVRIGENEISLMSGECIPTEAYHQELADRLQQILCCDDADILVGIPRHFLYQDYAMTGIEKRMVFGMTKKRKFLLSISDKNKTYVDTGLTHAYQVYTDINFETYYDRINLMLKNRDITVICGKGILDTLEYNVLNECKSVEYIDAPKRNAYLEYEVILNNALQIDQNRLVCVVLGATAKPLVMDLHHAGYQVWDMGHYFKDYDAYRKNLDRNDEEIEKFYRPD